MPAPQRVSTETLVRAVRGVAEREGLDGVTMSAVAAAVGVRPPSLYKRAENRLALLRLAADDAAAELTGMIDAVAASTPDPRARLVGIAHALRTFAARSPRVTTLLFSAEGTGPSAGATAPVMRILLETMTTIAPDDPLSAARTLTAWAYGFCTMEQSGAFRQGGDVDEAFAHGLDAVLRGLGA